MTTTEMGRRPLRHAGTVITLGGAVIAIDVLTKNWAIERLATNPISLLGGFVDLIETRNPGAAFSLGTSVTPLLACIALVTVVVVLVVAVRVRSTKTAIVLALLFGGAGGNLVDRLFRDPGVFRGHVVDWIAIGAWPTFNLADASLVIAAVWLFVNSLRQPRADHEDAV